MDSSSGGDESTRVGGPEPDPRRDGDELERGASVGRYVVIERVGHGGTATVYRAYDPKLRRDVALKMLRRDIVDAVGESRLVAEAQAMARLTHPNVVVVFDVMAERNGVVFAMELVEGGTLGQWLASKPPTQRIIDIFVAAGRGLATAHAAQLIHRDFKPSNVLMGGGEVPKVADFGLVRRAEDDDEPASSHELGGNAEDTRTRNTAVVGTPRFMSPEQIEARPIDARTDQYSFCVALWEALARRPLFEGDIEALRKAKRKPAPALPNDVGVSAVVAAALARGLATDPALRWPDMDALLTELAEQPGRTRRRRLKIVGVAASVPLVALTAWSLRPAPRCSDEIEPLAGVWSRDETNDPATSPMRARAREQIDSYAEGWLARHQDACEATWVHGTHSVAQMDLRVACLLGAKAKLAAVIELVARDDAAPVALELVAALPRLDACDDVARLEASAGRPTDPALASGIDELRQELARTQATNQAGAHDEAEPQARALLERARVLGDPAVLVEAAIALASVHDRLARYDEAERELGEALRTALATGDRGLQLDAINALVFHFTHEVAAPQRAEWLGLVGIGLAAAADADPVRAAEAYSGHGAMLRGIGRYEEAEAAHRHALALRIATFGEEHSHVAAARNNLGLVLYDRREFAAAAHEQTTALEIWRNAFGDDHPRIALARGNLGNSLEGAGRYEEAVTELRAALELRLAIVGPDHPDVGISRNDLSIALTSAEQYREAEREIVEALRIWTSSHGAQSRLVALGYNNLGLALEQQGRLDEADAAFRRSAELVERVMGPRHPLVARIVGNQARVAFATDRAEEAEQLYRRSLALHEQVVSADDPIAARLMARLAEVLLARGQRDEAKRLADRAAAIVNDPQGNAAPDDRMEVERVTTLLLRSK